MARNLFAKSKLLLLRPEPSQLMQKSTRSLSSREAKRGQGDLSNLLRLEEKGREEKDRTVDFASWVPHPRTGIYYPKGHEWVMESIPDGAASFNQTYWLRASEGVDHEV
ncbi:myb-like protein W isoform X1 [Cinnamomum micranthum f. kanehirae]|uniref:Myb-like protein W isoform X1 n=1 Tax=Cinnamomum micranthum f. kanehirae TaxID=337451 RepID=A0A3S4NJE2_9MAGN|nr:myb-like protein W isoform X1 [Cinnamomum micranthum f. kanehirae]